MAAKLQSDRCGSFTHLVSLFSNLACYSVRGLLFNVVNMPAASLWVNKRMCVLTSVNVGMCVSQLRNER